MYPDPNANQITCLRLNCEPAKTEVTPAIEYQWSERTATKPTVNIKLQLTNQQNRKYNLVIT